MKIVRNRVKKNGGNDFIQGDFPSLIKTGGGKSLPDEIVTGINNTGLYRRFPGFYWPLWVPAEAAESSPSEPYANPVLLNTTNRNWQNVTNYLSDGELKIDRAGMITGPGESGWSLEFWIFSKNTLFRPRAAIGGISASRNTVTGELEIRGDYRSISFVEKITGGKSNVNEAVISYTTASRTDMKDSMLVAAVRPYNMLRLGGLDRVEFLESGNLVKLNGRIHLACTRRPDRVIAVSGRAGDITPELLDSADSLSLECPQSMATMGLVFNLEGTSCSNTFRISLDIEKNLSPVAGLKYENTAKDFGILYSMRAGEGVTMELPDAKYMNVISQSRLTMLGINSCDYIPVNLRSAADAYFYVYGLIRAGQLREAANIVRQMINGLSFNEKKKDYNTSICAAYIISSFNELYIHKRDSDFLQENFTEIRRIGDYVYSVCSEIHTPVYPGLRARQHDTSPDSSERDIFAFYLAMSAMAYLSRCMGIFGQETKFRNEADRIQAIVRDWFDKKRSAVVLHGYNFSALLAFPERLYLSPGEEEYSKMFRNLFVSDDFPLTDKIYGVDMFSGFSVLNHMLAIRDDRIFEFMDKLLDFTDDFFSLPEFVNPVTGRGTWGSGNSKVLASLLFAVMRNMFFSESADRLELFPVPDERFFAPGKRLKIENAPSRFGMLSFNVETADGEIRILFTTLPKYVPADIRINLPFDTKIIEGDDFIIKKKVNNTYFINGWPSAVRFRISGRSSAN